MKKSTILTKHLKLCEEAYTLMLQENQWLRSNASTPEQPILNDKKSLLDALRESTQNLRSLNSEKQQPLDPAATDVAKKAQNMLLKIFMLDRENEQLLLRATLKEQNRLKNKIPSTKELKSVYEKDGIFKRRQTF